ncbi:MAG: 1-acyl-sn-glycerol-3-phosphate acyltransferase [Rhizobiaceae bacterium]
MFDSVSIPLWIAIVFGLFGVIGLLDRIIGPGFRWFFRRKANLAIDELNTRLHLRIQPFKTTKRQSLIDQLLLDGAVVKAIEAHVTEANVPREVAMAKAEHYAKEIVPNFNAFTYSKIGTRLARWASTFVYRVRLGYADDDGLSKIDPEATVVFVMNHRSNMDYVLVTYLASASATLSYAVGEWARVWLLQNLIHAMGAYFIRRDSGNLLYRRVLARYVAMATRSGVTQAIFPEGGLSRDGHLRDPKFGLLGYMIGGHDQAKHRDVVFVPVGLNYDRVLEDRILTGVGRKAIGESTFKVGFGGVLGFIWNLLKLRFQGKLYRYGYACASFGKPISLQGWLAKENTSFVKLSSDKRFKAIEKFGTDLMGKVGDVVPVLPVALVSTVIKESKGEPLSELDMKAKVLSLVDELESQGAHLYIPRMDRDYAITTGLRMLTLRKLIIEKDGYFEIMAGEEQLIDYYVNSIAHLRKNKKKPRKIPRTASK